MRDLLDRGGLGRPRDARTSSRRGGPRSRDALRGGGGDRARCRRCRRRSVVRRARTREIDASRRAPPLARVDSGRGDAVVSAGGSGFARPGRSSAAAMRERPDEVVDRRTASPPSPRSAPGSEIALRASCGADLEALPPSTLRVAGIARVPVRRRPASSTAGGTLEALDGGVRRRRRRRGRPASW